MQPFTPLANFACSRERPSRKIEARTKRRRRIALTAPQQPPRRINVEQDDLVRIELSTLDIAHSMTVDAYRIAKRVSPGVPVTFEFRADQAGTFPFYCNLQLDEGCRQMRGELIVRSRR